MTKYVRRCGKRGYRDNIAALMALADIRHDDSSRRVKQEVRAYHCPRCHRWHLTSKPLLQRKKTIGGTK